MFTLPELESVIPLVRASVPPTPQYAWPLLKERTGVEVVVKHENHTPIGAFKVRGGIVYFDRLKRARPQVQGIATATRGNHGQSLAFAGARVGVAVSIVVPRDNSIEKNAAMHSLGAELIEYGRDFDEAKAPAISVLVLPLVLSATPAWAEGTPVRVRGTVVSLDGSKLVVCAKDGKDVTVSLKDPENILDQDHC
jgi:threonine synthase